MLLLLLSAKEKPVFLCVHWGACVFPKHQHLFLCKICTILKLHHNYYPGCAALTLMMCLLCVLIFLALCWIMRVSSMFKMYSTSSEAIEETHNLWLLLYNYPPKRRWIVVDIYRDAKCRGIYPPLFTVPEGDSRFSVYQIRWIKKHFFNFFFWNFHETMPHFSLHSQNSEYPRVFRVMGANQKVRKLLSTDLVNTNRFYFVDVLCYSS